DSRLRDDAHGWESHLAHRGGDAFAARRGHVPRSAEARQGPSRGQRRVGLSDRSVAGRQPLLSSAARSRLASAVPRRRLSQGGSVSSLFPFVRTRGAAVYVFLIIALAAATAGGRAQSSQSKPDGADAPPKKGQAQAPTTAAGDQPRFRAGTNFVRVDAYPSVKGVAVRDLTAPDFEVLEDGVPQKVETFEHVEVRGPGPQEARVEPNNAREARAIAESTTGRLFVVFLDTYHTEEGGSHRMQRILVNLLNKVVGPDDMYAVMTPDMSAADISFARKTDVMEDYLAKYWFWGQRERLWPEDPVEQHYFECHPEQGMSSSCNSPLGVQRQADNVYAGVAREMVARRHEKKV